jgi:hypothetical protein
VFRIEPNLNIIGIQIGSPGRAVYGCNVRTHFANCAVAAINFVADGGNGRYEGLVYAPRGADFIGDPAANSTLGLQVSGQPGLSVIRSGPSDGQLGFSGVQPIGRPSVS